MSRRTPGLQMVPGLNSCERIRPERSRNPIQRLVWGPGSQFQTGHGVNVLEDEGSNPRMALRRLLRLYEGRQYREAASFLMKLPHYTLKAALPDIPVDLLIETLPHSLALLEALYSRLLELNVCDAKVVRAEQVLWRVVHLVSVGQDHLRPRVWCKLLATLARLVPASRSLLVSRKRALDRAVEGLGKHGLVASDRSTGGESTGSDLVPLPVALKDQLEIRTDAYKLALHKIESLGKHAGAHKDHGVQAASHQRQLSMKYSEVQQRLIDNQSLLNTLEKPGGSASLDELLSELKRRVEQDKEALRQWTALRKSTVAVNAKNPPLAARLLQFSRGCALALQLMNEDGPQAFQPDENLDDYEEESSSAGYHTDESCSPTPEPVVTGDENATRENLRGKLRDELRENLRKNLRENIQQNFHDNLHEHLRENLHEHLRENLHENLRENLHEHLRENLHEKVYNNARENVCEEFAEKLDDKLDEEFRESTVQRLAEMYSDLYSLAHLHTLDALDALEPLNDAPELKSKILYSVVVLSWRLAGTIQASRRLEALKILNGGTTSIIKTSGCLDRCVTRQLATSGADSGSCEVAQQVLGQLKRTLYDFPCLGGCEELKNYARACSSLAWSCLARETPLVLDVAQGLDFRREVHARHRNSREPNGTRIAAVIWPGLREGCQGPCLRRAIVLTH